MNEVELYSRIAELKVIPVVAIDSEDDALALADALIEGQLPIAEITFRTPVAAKVMKRITSERPGVLVGAGTVTNADQVDAAVAAGAAFAVSPGTNPAVIKAAAAAGLPLAPGVMTPSDVESALAAGAKVLKFFPAGAAGGVPLLKSLAGPYSHLGVRFIPTGGINLDNLDDYLSLPTVLAVGGTWVATSKDIAAGNWETIRDNCLEIRTRTGVA